jgi:hypothetical protein
MPVHETKKQSDLEKRLRILRQSLNVTEASGKKSHSKESSGSTYSISKDLPVNSTSKTVASDVSYLRQDLLKIVVLSAIAFAVQAGLYFAITHNYLKLQF